MNEPPAVVGALGAAARRCVLSLVLLQGLPALAKEPASSRDARAESTLVSCGGRGPALEMVLVGEAALPGLASSICDWFRDEPWRLRIRRGSDPGQSAPHPPGVFVVLESRERARVSIAAADGRRWVRDVALVAVSTNRASRSSRRRCTRRSTQRARLSPPRRTLRYPPHPSPSLRVPPPRRRRHRRLR